MMARRTEEGFERLSSESFQCAKALLYRETNRLL